MENTYIYKDLGLLCNHCGKPIVSRPALQNGGIVITGFEPMEHRHIHDGSLDCKVVTRDIAHPYTDMGLRDKYLNAEDQ